MDVFAPSAHVESRPQASAKGFADPTLAVRRAHEARAARARVERELAERARERVRTRAFDEARATVVEARRRVLRQVNEDAHALGESMALESRVVVPRRPIDEIFYSSVVSSVVSGSPGTGA